MDTFTSTKANLVGSHQLGTVSTFSNTFTGASHFPPPQKHWVSMAGQKCNHLGFGHNIGTQVPNHIGDWPLTLQDKPTGHRIRKERKLILPRKVSNHGPVK